MSRATLKIPNMMCPACVAHLEALEDELKGVSFVKASYHKQRMEVEFDEGKIGLDEIRAAVINLGYEVAETIAA